MYLFSHPVVFEVVDLDRVEGIGRWARPQQSPRVSYEPSIADVVTSHTGRRRGVEAGWQKNKPGE